MRASEIRNQLIQKFGVDPSVVAKIIDKRELKQMLLSFMIQQQSQERFDIIKSNVVSLLYMLVVLFLMFLAFKPVLQMLKSFRSKDNKPLFKLKLGMSNIKKRNYLGGITMLLSFFLDILASSMTLSTFMSWVLPYGSPLRRFMVPMFSFAVNTDMLRSLSGGAAGGASSPLSPASHSRGGVGSSSSGSYGLDVGPMLTIMLVNWLVKKLEEVSAATVIDRARAREDKKARKKFRAQFGLSKQEQEQEEEDLFPSPEGRTYEEELFLAGIDPHHVSSNSSTSNNIRTNKASSEAGSETPAVEKGGGDDDTSKVDRFIRGLHARSLHSSGDDDDEDDDVGADVAGLRRRGARNASANSSHNACSNAVAAAAAQERRFVDTAHLYGAADRVDTLCVAASLLQEEEETDRQHAQHQQQVEEQHAGQCDSDYDMLESEEEQEDRKVKEEVEEEEVEEEEEVGGGQSTARATESAAATAANTVD